MGNEGPDFQVPVVDSFLESCPGPFTSGVVDGHPESPLFRGVDLLDTPRRPGDPESTRPFSAAPQSVLQDGLPLHDLLLQILQLLTDHGRTTGKVKGM